MEQEGVRLLKTIQAHEELRDYRDDSLVSSSTAQGVVKMHSNYTNPIYPLLDFLKCALLPQIQIP